MLSFEASIVRSFSKADYIYAVIGGPLSHLQWLVRVHTLLRGFYLRKLELPTYLLTARQIGRRGRLIAQQNCPPVNKPVFTPEKTSLR